MFKYDSCEECEAAIIKKLEQKFISSALKVLKERGQNYFEVGSRQYDGKTYQIFITVKESKNA
jgi:hypothetical protein